MTLRDFIEQERRECHIFDIEEFGEKLKSLKWEDGEEIEPKEFENYLDYNVESAAFIQEFGMFYYSTSYEISLYYWEEE